LNYKRANRGDGYAGFFAMGKTMPSKAVEQRETVERSESNTLGRTVGAENHVSPARTDFSTSETRRTPVGSEEKQVGLITAIQKLRDREASYKPSGPFGNASIEAGKEAPITPGGRAVSSGSILSRANARVSDSLIFSPTEPKPSGMRHIGVPADKRLADDAMPVSNKAAASIRPPAAASGITGELWLDTFSLRDWLHSYMLNELGRASAGKSRAEDVFAGV
jgi:hypothetical protein